MDIHVGLSAERIDSRLPKFVTGVGMLRSEYLCRRIGYHLPAPRCQEHIVEYVEHVLGIFPEQPVWYRTFDAPSNEVNMLLNHDAHIVEETPLVGIRGMRRAVMFKKTFELEIELVSELAAKHSNLHLMFPFVNELDELEYGMQTASHFGFRNRIAAMIETPSAVQLTGRFMEMGVSDFLVGLNDLASLFAASARGLGFDRHDNPALISALRELRERHEGATLSVGGYLQPPFLDNAKSIGFDNLVVHYSSLPDFTSADASELPEVDFMANFKKTDNEKRMLKWAGDLLRVARTQNESGLQGSGPRIERSTWLDAAESTTCPE